MAEKPDNETLHARRLLWLSIVLAALVWLVVAIKTCHP